MFSCLQGRYFVPLESWGNQWAQISLCPSLSPTNMICVSMSISVFSISFAVGYQYICTINLVWRFELLCKPKLWKLTLRVSLCMYHVRINLPFYVSIQSSPVQSNSIQSVISCHICLYTYNIVQLYTIIRIMEGRTDGLQDVGRRDRRRGGCVGDCHSCHLWIKAVSIS
jgi:hypothetical protein